MCGARDEVQGFTDVKQGLFLLSYIPSSFLRKETSCPDPFLKVPHYNTGILEVNVETTAPLTSLVFLIVPVPVRNLNPRD